jgi:hypothetical protein
MILGVGVMRFKTNKRLWLAVSAVLFVACWFIPTIGVQPAMPGFVLLLGFFDPAHFREVLPIVAILLFAFASGAVIVGWILQCVFVMLRHARSRP